jgi:hypothetical protein
MMGGPGTPLERHVWLTKFIGAVTELSDAAGIYWGNGTVVHHPDMFCERAESLTADNPFPLLWIDMRLWQEAQSIRFATTGLFAFGLPEVEVDRAACTPDELFAFCGSVVSYVLERGSAIPDGDTIGRSVTEKVKVRHSASMWDRKGDVMKLVFA